jgi:hypothetical protein
VDGREEMWGNKQVSLRVEILQTFVKSFFSKRIMLHISITKPFVYERDEEECEWPELLCGA